MLTPLRFGGLTPPAAATFITNPLLITKYRVVCGCDGWIWMPRNRAERGRQRVGGVEVGILLGTGVSPLRRGPLVLAYSTAP